jgi:L,D-transpeptidase catalytic domain
MRLLLRSLICVLLLLNCCSPSFAAGARPDMLSALVAVAGDINPKILQIALQANQYAADQRLVHCAHVITIIDYSLPSTRKRLWTFDLDHQKLLFHEWVAHGKNSGENETVSFSNEEGSLMSSIGFYATDDPYIGKNGYSLRLKGLEKGFNDNIYSRAVVLHGAWYVSDSMIRSQGRLGRSWGCPAVRKEVAAPLIDAIKGGSLILSYYPDRDWLAHSLFLQTLKASL